MVDLSRFRDTDPAVHAAALAEITQGRKIGHWMWFVFPQLRGLGRSPMAELYGLEPDEAAPYLADSLLGGRLVGISRALMRHAGRKTDVEIFGRTDAMKLRSSMTLFASVPHTDRVFSEVIESFCIHPCMPTLARLRQAGLD